MRKNSADMDTIVSWRKICCGSAHFDKRILELLVWMEYRTAVPDAAIMAEMCKIVIYIPENMEISKMTMSTEAKKRNYRKIQDPWIWHWLPWSSDSASFKQNRISDRALQGSQKRPSFKTWSSHAGWSAQKIAELPQEQGYSEIQDNYQGSWSQKVIKNMEAWHLWASLFSILSQLLYSELSELTRAQTISFLIKEFQNPPFLPVDNTHKWNAVLA